MSERRAGRIIAGSARGTVLRAPGGQTRPMGDRVKQTLFAIIEPDLPGVVAVDLYAGSGAAGLEALSRGAARVTFVDADRRAAAAITANLARARLAGPRAEVIVADVAGWLGSRGATDHGPFGLAIVDPPYASFDLVAATLEGLVPHLGPGARVVVKHFWRDRPAPAIGLLASERERRFGETTLTFYRRQEGR